MSTLLHSVVCPQDPTGIRKVESIFHVGFVAVAVHLKPFRLQDWELRKVIMAATTRKPHCAKVFSQLPLSGTTPPSLGPFQHQHRSCSPHCTAERGADQSEFREKGCSASEVELTDRALSVLQEIAEILT